MRRRIPKAHAPTNLADLKYWELVRLAERGEITWEQVRNVTAARVRARYGGVDPFAHLRPLGESDDD